MISKIRYLFWFLSYLHIKNFFQKFVFDPKPLFLVIFIWFFFSRLPLTRQIQQRWNFRAISNRFFSTIFWIFFKNFSKIFFSKNWPFFLSSLWPFVTLLLLKISNSSFLHWKVAFIVNPWKKIKQIAQYLLFLKNFWKKNFLEAEKEHLGVPGLMGNEKPIYFVRAVQKQMLVTLLIFEL